MYARKPQGFVVFCMHFAVICSEIVATVQEVVVLTKLTELFLLDIWWPAQYGPILRYLNDLLSNAKFCK